MFSIDRDALKRRDDESVYCYYKRLVDGKLEDKTLGDFDYSELSSYLFGKEYSSDVARRMMYGAKKTLDAISESIEDIYNDTDKEFYNKQKIDIMVERQRLHDERVEYNRAIRSIARYEEIKDMIKSALIKDSELDDEEPIHYSPEINTIRDGKTLLVGLNDIHYGICVNNEWSYYSPEACAFMMSCYVSEVIDIATKNCIDDVVIYCNGDLISGNIHKNLIIQNRENVVDQVFGVSRLIYEFITYLSENLKCNITFIGVPGNHSRIDIKEDASVCENMDNIIFWYLSAKFEDNNKVFIVNGETDAGRTMNSINIRGRNYLCVHGDMDSFNKINKLVSMSEDSYSGKVYAVLLGHGHHNKIETVNGVKCIMSGSFVGCDEYCIKNRIFGKQEQVVSICDSTGIICNYDIDLSKYSKLYYSMNNCESN